MTILSIDTTAEICSVALKSAGDNLHFHEHRPREHAKILLPEIERLLQQAAVGVNELELIVFGRGPGSFTGVRIATGVAQGLAYASGCPVLPVSTLQSIAFSLKAQPGATVWAALDARMSEIYFAAFVIDAQGIPVLQGEEQVLAPERLTQTVPEGCLFVGNGWHAGYPLPDQITEAAGFSSPQHPLPDAADSLQLAVRLLEAGMAETVSADQAMPVYLRDKVTWDKKPGVGS